MKTSICVFGRLLWELYFSECGEWVRSNANTDGEKLVGYVNSTEECLSLYYSDPECYKSGATMANIDKTNGYDEASGIDNYGTCWCQFGDTIKVDDDECCITTWAKDCEEQKNRNIDGMDNSIYNIT